MSPPPEDQDLEQENYQLLNRITELQKEKWVLEEKINHLEQGCSAMAEDLMHKTELIQFYCMERRPGSSPYKLQAHLKLHYTDVPHILFAVLCAKTYKGEINKTNTQYNTKYWEGNGKVLQKIGEISRGKAQTH